MTQHGNTTITLPGNRYIYEHEDLKFVQVQSLFPKEALDLVRTEFELLHGDVVITSYPKAGTTWLAEIVYLLHNNCDLTEAKSRPISARVHMVESSDPSGTPSSRLLASQLPPRLLNTHLYPVFYHRALLKPAIDSAKFVLVFRDPRDVLVSYYHFHFLLESFGGGGTWEEYFELYKAKLLPNGDVLDWMVDWWRHRDHPNVLIVRYEDLHERHSETIMRVAQFLGKCDVTDDVIEQIREATTFKAMSSNPSSNFSGDRRMNGKGKFMRKGEVGDWRNYFSDEQAKYVEDRIQQQLVPLGIEY